MPTTTIPVHWVNGQPQADNVTITTEGDNTIQWVPDPGVTITGISALPNPPFTQQPTAANNWTADDDNTSAGSYSYTIAGTNTILGVSGTHDPQITNEPE